MRILLAACLLASCGSDATLIVQVRTDLTPGVEMDRIVVTLDGTVFTTPSVDGADWGRGVRVAEVTRAPGPVMATVAALRSDGTTIVSRPVRAELDDGELRVVTVLLTRDCATVMCPDGGDPSAIACLAGRCVPDTCTEETPELCPMPECTVSSDCPASSVDCLASECSSGACFAPEIPGVCDTDERCDPGLGCVMVGIPPAECGDGVCGAGETIASCEGDCGIAEVSAGNRFTCARTRTGSLWCWGRNDNGELGNGMRGTSSDRPVEVMGIADAVSIGTGLAFACAARVSGVVSCWGQNSQGQLGNDALGTNSDVPVDVQGIDDATAVAVGGFHACALSRDGRVRCWGEGSRGTLGDGLDMTSASPVDVGPVVSAMSISAGDEHTCLVTGTGEVFCWGQGDQGQMGDGDSMDASTPGEIFSLSSISAISMGANHGCAADSLAVRCWGEGDGGQLGLMSLGDSAAPALVDATLPGALGLGAGAVHSCAIDELGVAWCWGRNLDGQLGDGTTDFRLSPGRLAGSGPWSQIDAGTDHTCGVSFPVGTVHCWGANGQGQLGIASAMSASRPQIVTDL